MGRTAAPSACFKAGKGRRIRVVAADVAQFRGEFIEACGLEVAALLDALAGALFESVQGPARARHADDGDVEAVAVNHGIQGGKRSSCAPDPCRSHRRRRRHPSRARSSPRLQLTPQQRSNSSIKSSASATPARLISRSRSRRSARRVRRRAAPLKRHSAASISMTLSTPSSTSSLMCLSSTAKMRLKSSTVSSADSSTMEPDRV